jgi:hypothetical protein
LVRRDPTQNGHDRLDEAMALLIQNQAAFVGSQAETNHRVAEYQREMREYERQTAEHFAHIEADMAVILRVLAEHGRILEQLPEAIRDKIGFKAPSKQD